MIFKYYVSIDEGGDIKCFCKSKACDNPCKEYVVKLISIDRQPEELEAKVKGLDRATDKVVKDMKRFSSEFNKTIKGIRRIIK